MCDEKTNEENESAFASGNLTRRQFAVGGAAAAMAIVLPIPANAMNVVESEINVPTPDGVADSYFVHPSSGQHPGVIIWPDIFGLRSAFRLMGKRLAQSGYSVLVVNPFYRRAKAPVIKEGASFSDPETRGILFPLMQSLTPVTQATDAKAFVRFLDASAVVDLNAKIGTMGYCMGGPITMRTAAAVPERIGAGASFHGGGLVGEGVDSPHLLVPKMKASFLFAIADNDDKRQPDAKDILRKSYDAAGLPAEIEVYTGAMHGWCPPDSEVYNESQAERAWSRLLVLFDSSLKKT